MTILKRKSLEKIGINSLYIKILFSICQRHYLNFFREILTESDFYNENLKKFNLKNQNFRFFHVFSTFFSSNSNTISANTPKIFIMKI